MSKRTVRPKGQAIEVRRRNRGWSQEILGEHAGLSKRTIENIEKSKPILLATLVRLADALEADCADICDDADFVSTTAGTAPAPPSALLQSINRFEAVVEDRSAGFVGRRFLFDAVNRFLAEQTLDSGYMLIRGEPGIGKSAFLAQLVKTSDCVYHFNVGLQAINTAAHFLANVCAQLIVRFGLPYSELPPGTCADGTVLNMLLGQVSQRLGEQEDCLLLIDALDEVSAVGLDETVNLLFLPESLPRGIFVVATTRPLANLRLNVSRQRNIDLKSDDSKNVDDVREYIDSRVNDDAIRRWLLMKGVAPNELIETLSRKSEGNFMYIHHVLFDLTDPESAEGTLEDLPEGLRAYYRRHWDKMRSWNQSLFDTLHRPVVCVLAAAKEALPLAEIAAPTGRQPHEVLQVIREWREFLDVEGGRETEPRFRIYHASFRDFLAEEVDPGLRVHTRMIIDDAMESVRRTRRSRA